MRRAPAVLGATLAGLAGVFAFHSHPTTGVLSAASVAPGAPPSSPPTTARSGHSPATQPPPTHATPATSPPGAASTASATGTTVQYGYGELAVRVTVTGKRISGISVPKLQTAESYSQTLATQVIPMLRSEVLSVQSARINGISGATYTSEAFAQSLQAALNKLHFA